MEIDIRNDPQPHPYSGYGFPQGEETSCPVIVLGDHNVLLTEDQMEVLATNLLSTIGRTRRIRVVSHFL